jgi:hypothetical protein
MAEKTPAAEQPYLVEDTTPTPWAEVRERLADTYWLATVRPDGLPHLAPLLGIKTSTRKPARSLTSAPREL